MTLAPFFDHCDVVMCYKAEEEALGIHRDGWFC